MSSAISHEPFLAVDWAAMRETSPAVAADALGTILRSLDGIEDQVFVARGMSGLIFEERRLYELTGQSFDAWLKTTCPKSWGYVRDAMRTVAALRDTPFTELIQIKRCNLKVLETVSSGVRPQVIEAAKSMTENDLRKKIREDHPEQHVEEMRKLILTFPAGDYETVCSVLDQVGEAMGETSREGQLLAWCIDYQQEVRA